ncbi:MAG: AhpC/TSA family protein [Bacteroidales bacterium]|nr:AhpC/TSA family protein [Bacteroidales bacterium]MCB8998616.1 AhpC/TSA family protein [Bacteroidales bacterium]MCB9012516.1 AhpC/TSA family protein [Bacteroidales bacterium]
MLTLNKILFVATAFLLFSCGGNNSNSDNSGRAHKFSIEGSFEHGAGKPLYLQKIGVENFIPVDTTTLDNEGRFSFTASTEGPEFFILRTETGPFINLILYGKEKIKVLADYDSIQKYTINGSEESAKIQELNAQTFKVISEIDKFSAQSRDSINSPNYTKIMVKNNEAFKELMNGLREYSDKFISDNQGSLISLLALYGQVGQQMMVFHPVDDIEVYERVDSSLFSKYPDLPLAKDLHQYIASVKAQIAAQQAPSGSPAIGTEVPDISLPSPDGKIIKLSSLRGKIVLLDFWASWCQPCRHENPNLVENYAKYHSKGFEIYQVSLDKTREDWLKGIKDDKLSWTHVSELKYWESAVVKEFNIQGIPSNFLLDKDGKIIATNLRGPDLGAKLEEIFK